MNQFLEKMERKYGRFAIHNLMLYVGVLYVAGYIFYLINPSFYYQYLALNVYAILHGQVWRIITFLLMPTNTNIIFLAISVYFYVFLGRTLENIWGAFKFNVYYFSGVLFTIIGAFILYFVTGKNYIIGTQYLNMSIFMAFAVTIPDMQVLLMFIIPIKVKWLAYLDGALLAYEFVQALIFKSYGTCISIFMCFLNFFIFFFVFMRKGHFAKQFIRRQKFQKAARQGYERRGYMGQGPSYNGAANQTARKIYSGNKITRHKCAVCGRTEQDGEDLEFRFCSKCNGNYEYCQNHLFTHTHIQ